MKQPLFVYGTLRDPRILKKAIGRATKGIPAVALDYQRKTIQLNKEPFPIIIKRKKSKVRGKLLFITEQELKKLDEYEEATIYKRKKVALEIGKTAWAYMPC